MSLRIGKFFHFLEQLPEITYNCYRRIFDYKGRSTRKEIWAFYIANNFILPLLVLLISKVFSPISSQTGIDFFFILYVAFAIAYCVASLPLLVRRYRDTGQKAEWLGGIFVPLLLAIMLPPGSFVQSFLISISFTTLFIIFAFTFFWPSKKIK